MRSPLKMPAREPGVSSIGAITVTWPSFMPTIQPESAELPLGVVLQFLKRIGIQKFAVRIELADGALERGINQLAIGQILAVHIFAVDFLERVVEQVPRSPPRCRVVGRLRGAQINVRAQRQIEHQRHQHQAENKTAFHNWENLPRRHQDTKSLN